MNMRERLVLTSLFAYGQCVDVGGYTETPSLLFQGSCLCHQGQCGGCGTWCIVVGGHVVYGCECQLMERYEISFVCLGIHLSP